MSKPTKSIIFNKYRIKKLIASTHFGWLYEGINIKEKEPVAMKFEKKSSKYNLLESEAYILFYLKGFGIPKLISYGKSGPFNILIEELLGLSIQAIWNDKKYNNKYKIKDISMIALQCLDRLEYIHSKYIIHRDIKPLNITIGKENPNIIYLIDFGFAHKYRSTRTGKHIKYNNIKKILGSMRYLSINANKGYEQSRRDDLESLGYMLIYLAKNNLPWIEIEKQKIPKTKKYKLVYLSKKKNVPEKLCSGLPKGFIDYFKYVKKLEFEQDPDYNHLKKLFLDILDSNNYKNEFIFSWILNKKIKSGKNAKSLDNKSYDKINSLNKKGKEHSQRRLYHKIKESMEMGRAKSQDYNNDRHKILNLEKSINNKFINNIIPIDKKNEKILEYKSPQKENKMIPIIYKRKKIPNIKIIKNDKKDINLINIKINNKENKNNENINKNHIRNKENKLKIFEISFDNKYNNSNDSINKPKISLNGMEKNKRNIDIFSYNYSPRNKYIPLKDRDNSLIDKVKNINNIKKIKKKQINIKGRNKIIPKYKEIIDINDNKYDLYINNLNFTENNFRTPFNYNNGNNIEKYHFKNLSNNCVGGNTFKSNGLDLLTEYKSKNDIIRLNLSPDEFKYKQNLKMYKNNNINIKNHKKIYSSINILNNNIRAYIGNRYENNNINNYNYISPSFKREKDILFN